MFRITDDPIADFFAHEDSIEKELEKYPKCCCCEEPIQDDYFYDIDGDYFCESCIANYRKDTDTYIGY